MTQMIKNPPAMRTPQFNPRIGKIPWRKAWQPTPVFLPGESLWTEKPGELSVGSQELDTTERLSTAVRFYIQVFHNSGAFQVVLVVKNPPANAGDIKDVSLIPRSKKSPGGEHGNPLWYSCLVNPMGRGA